MRALLAVGGIQEPHDSLEGREIYTEDSVVWEGMQRESERLFGGGKLHHTARFLRALHGLASNVMAADEPH